MTNKIEISGKIFKPQVKSFSSGKILTEFGLSVWTGKKDDKNTYEFITCKLWGDLTDIDGDKIVQGRLAFDSWVKDGKKQVKPYILVDSVRKGNFDNYKQTNNEKQSDDFENAVPW